MFEVTFYYFLSNFNDLNNLSKLVLYAQSIQISVLGMVKVVFELLPGLIFVLQPFLPKVNDMPDLLKLILSHGKSFIDFLNLNHILSLILKLYDKKDTQL